jgi:SulP family sulfate permease
VLAGLLTLAPLLAYLPMASMAAILLLVAWNIADFHQVVRFFRSSPKPDVLVMLSCLTLTVLFDMVIAIAVGVVLAALLFMRDISELTKVSDISEHKKWVPQPLPLGWSVYKINGPLFYAAADRIFAELAQMAKEREGIILYMDGVSMLDAGGLAALTKFLDASYKHNAKVIIADLQFQPLKTLARAGMQPVAGKLLFTSTLDEALSAATDFLQLRT